MRNSKDVSFPGSALEEPEPAGAQLHTEMIEQAPVGIVLMDMETLGFLEFNDAACGALGYARREFAKLTLREILVEWKSEAKLKQHLASIRKNATGHFETVHRSKNGALLDTHVSFRLIEIRGRLCSLAFWTDNTERKSAEKTLRMREQEVRSLVERTPDGIIRYDRHLRRMFVNPAAARFLGHPPEKLLGVSIENGPLLDKTGYRALLEKIFETGQEMEIELEALTLDGEIVCGLTRIIPEFDKKKRVMSVLTITRDITEMVRQRREINRLAFFDPLTGLPNRALLQDRVRQEAAEFKRQGGMFALMVLDIDNFKDLNDTLGPADGDRILREIARRLASCIRQSDTLTRLGGDEFAVLLPDIRSGQDMGSVAGAILKQLARPIRVGNRDVFTSASIGIAVYPENTRKLSELFTFAEMAMYHAKAKGRNNFQFHDAKLTDAAQRRLTLATQLRQAVSNGELELYYQPKVHMPEGRVLGAEALLRWNHPVLGLLTPEKFIGIAEDTGLIVGIGHWVLKQACAAVVRWNSSRVEPLHVAVNLSGRQFVRSDLAALVRDALESNGCRGSWLELEITESIMLKDNRSIQKTLESLRAMGATIAIDDFGTGHSALCYLNRFRVDVLKIDRSFLASLESDRRKEELVKAFIAVAGALDMGVVVEGVESTWQAGFLCENGCFVGQGYLYGKPMPLESFEALLDMPLTPLETHQA